MCKYKSTLFQEINLLSTFYSFSVGIAEMCSIFKLSESFFYRFILAANIF